MLQHDMEAYRARWSGFGWNALVVDGHDVDALVSAFATAAATTGRPTVLLARTFKGKGISFMEDRPDWHGKAVKKGDELDRALAELAKGLDPSVLTETSCSTARSDTSPTAQSPMCSP